MMSDRSIVAAFDFDGTISYCDTLLPFLWSFNGAARTSANLLIDSPAYAAYACHLKTRQVTKEILLTRFLKGMTIKDLGEKGAFFASKYLPFFIKPKALNCIQWHLSQGHFLVLISANLDLYLKPWAQKVGFQSVISSSLEIDFQEKATGKLAGKNCWGEEKVRRLLDLLGPKENFQLYAYGDSRGDFELLKLADYPFYRTFPKI